jgi:tRNA G18 (ribose-2'-O)-methylase SpoU
MKAPLILILHDIRSAHNVGSIFRTADGAGLARQSYAGSVSGGGVSIYLTGYTPCPPKPGALYLSDADKALQKTALGAETSVSWRQVASISRLLTRLRNEGYELVALEQMPGSIDYREYRPGKRVALILGNEVGGVAPEILKRSDHVIEIPMYGAKNSLNVSVATGIALYQIISTMKE